MKSKGIRIEVQDILDKELVPVELPDILAEIRQGNKLHWAILYLEADRIEPPDSLFISWIDLYDLAQKSPQISWLTLIGCKEKKHLHYYESDQEMAETCDIVIEMIDNSYWELFAKDRRLINRLALKFPGAHFLKFEDNAE